MENKIELLRHYFFKMLLIRKFEEKIDWLFARSLLPGTAHLCIGQEAVAVGAMAAINEDDLIISTHRGHGHLLAKDADPRRLMCEVMGREPGYCKGIGGTQHLCALEISFLGTNGITAGGIPVATGAGLALKLQKKNQIVLCFFGDGATNQGTFHESLNMASIWNVPVVYICENNLYAMSTPQAESMNIENIAQRASSYNIASSIVDGMDLLKVKDSVGQAVNRARKGEGPTLIKAKTYRYCGHSKSDRRKYRSKKEEGEWEKRDPIINFKDILLKAGVNQSEIDDLEEKAKGQIEISFEFARNSPFADSRKIFKTGVD